MSTSLLSHTQGVCGFQFTTWDFSGAGVTASITRRPDQFECVSCGSLSVRATPVDTRFVQGFPIGGKSFFLEVRMHRPRCHECDASRMERPPFPPSPKARYGKPPARTIVELRGEMSVSGLANDFGLHWSTVKELEKDHLARKFRTIRLAEVEVIGIDEIHVGDRGSLTVVRDLETGAVLQVGKKKGGEGLKGFWRRLVSSKCRIRAVAMDMAAG